MSQIRVEISGRDEFWKNAVLVEWQHQHPERPLIAEGERSYLIDEDLLDSLRAIAGECNSTVTLAPADPSRRLWIRQLFPSRHVSNK